MTRARKAIVPLAAAALIAAGLAAAPTVAAAPAPAAVSALRAFQTAHGVRLTWTNPRSAFDRVVVRYAHGTAAPRRTGDGRAVPVQKKAHTAALTGLAHDTRYAVTVWTADAAGHLSARAVSHFTSAEGAEPTGTIAGTVVDSGGHPLAGVRVGFDDPDTYTAAGPSVRTDSRGTFTAHRAPGHYDVTVDGSRATGGSGDSTGYIATIAEVAVRRGHTSALHVRLRPGGVITGRVLASGGVPVAGALVSSSHVGAFARVSGNGFSLFYADEAHVMTRKDGRYTLRGVPDAAVRTCVSTAQLSSGDVGGLVDSCSDRTVVVPTGRSRHVADTVLERVGGGALVVTVHDTSGRPLHYSTVEAYQPRGEGSGVGYTDAHGRTRITGLIAGAYRVCASSGRPGAAGSAPTGHLSRCTTATVTAGATRGARLALPIGAALGGVVRGPQGVPVAHSAVELDDSSGEESGYANTDARGHFVVADLAPGLYTVCATNNDATNAGSSPRGTRPACFGSHTRVLTVAGTTRIGVDITVAGAAAVRGVVRLSGGGAARDAQVFANARSARYQNDGGSTQADAKGRFTVRGLATAPYAVCAQQFFLSNTRQGACSTVHARVGHTVTTSVRLPAFGAATVHATLSGGTTPVAGSDAVLLKRCGRDEEDECDPITAFDPHTPVAVVASATTSADGSVRLDGVAPGHYALCVLDYDAATATGSDPSAGYADTCTSGYDVAITEATTSTPAALPVRPGAGFSGRVVDKAGHPIAGVRVHVSAGPVLDVPYRTGPQGSLDFVDPADAVTAADGTYTVRSVRPGTTTICFGAELAGTSKSGYLDQCVGGKPGHQNDGTQITLTAGENAADDQVLTAGPPRSVVSRAKMGVTTPVRRAGVVVDATGAIVRVVRLMPLRHRSTGQTSDNLLSQLWIR